LTATEICFTL